MSSFSTCSGRDALRLLHLLPSVKHLDYVAGVVDCPAVFTLRVKVANLLMFGSQFVTLLLVHIFTFEVRQQVWSSSPPRQMMQLRSHHICSSELLGSPCSSSCRQRMHSSQMHSPPSKSHVALGRVRKSHSGFLIPATHFMRHHTRGTERAWAE